MPITLPAPGLFSTKNCWPNALVKCSASTRPTMSVPPAGGEGTMMRTGCVGYSWASACPASRHKTKLTQRIEHRLCRHEDEGDHARLFAIVDPVVQRRLLHEHVARAQAHRALVQAHVDFAGHDHRVIDRLGAMVARCDAGFVAHDAEDR